MKYDFEAKNAPRVYRLVVKGDLLYIKAHNHQQATAIAKKAGYTVLSVSRWED